MTADDVIAGAMGKPAPFIHEGFTYFLRPLTRREVRTLFAKTDKDGVALQSELLAMAVCDGAGQAILTVEQADELPSMTVDALAREIARRNWEVPDRGKADSVETPG